MDNKDKIAVLRHRLAGDRMLTVVNAFKAENPLDSVVKTQDGKTAYGYIPEELASKTGDEAAPVIVTEELFDHLDVKGTRIKTVTDRGFTDMREAIEYSLKNPAAIAMGSGDGSINIYFKKDDNDKSLMYANFMFSKGPIPCYVARSISPVGKIKGDILYETGSTPSLEVPKDFDDKALETKITQSAGNRIPGKTWNAGNVMKGLRMHAQEGEYPNEAEIAEFKQWISEGKINHLSSGGLGMYINQALEQPNCAMFFEAAKDCGVWSKAAPDIEKIIDKDFLATMRRSENSSPEVKSALLLAHLVAASEDKTKAVKEVGVKYNLGGRDLAASFAKNHQNLANIMTVGAETAYKTVENVAGNKFENLQMLDDVLNVCKIKYLNFDKGAIKEHCNLIISAVKSDRAKVDVQSMSVEEKKAYFANKSKYDLKAVETALAQKRVSDKQKSGSHNL